MLAVAGGEQMASCISTYLTDVSKRPILSQTEEGRLARAAARGSDSAQRRLIEAHLGFVVRLARRYSRYGVPLEDLISVGNLGLILAARRYNPGAGVRFVTYAMWWVRKGILETLRLQSRLIAVPPRYAGRPVTTVSLDATPEGMTPLADRLHDPASPSPEHATLRRQMGAILRQALFVLEPRARRVMVLRHGLVENGPRTLEEIGQAQSLSRERIRQIEVQAHRRLRRILARRRV
jgi:RNA polymerase primary sigma factor